MDFVPKILFSEPLKEHFHHVSALIFHYAAYYLTAVVKLFHLQKIDYDNPHIIVINNSLEIEEMLISTSLIEEATKTGHILIESEPFDLEFDAEGNLVTKF